MNLSFLLAYFLTLDSMQWLQIISFIVGRCLLKMVSFSSLSMFKIAALTCLTNRGHIWASFPTPNVWGILSCFFSYPLFCFLISILLFTFNYVYSLMCLVVFVHKCSGLQNPEEAFSPLELEL